MNISMQRHLSRSHYTVAHSLRVLGEHFSPAVPRAPKGNNIVCASARGAYITCTEGRRYLDFANGIGVSNTGHSHPRVVEAITRQIQDGIHLQQNCMISQPTIALCEKLLEVAPEGLTRFFFNCTGSEAVESAIKLARHETGRQNIIAFNGGFHGRSLAALAVTSSKVVYRAGYGPLPSGFYTAKYPYCLHCAAAPPSGGCCGDALESVRVLLREQTAPSETAAILIEPILGEGGYTVPPPGFLAGLRALCDEHGMLLIVDEVQSGVGRTGKWWGVQHEAGVTPDILVFAKAIASGVPLSGIMTRGSLMGKSPPGSMGGTYGATAIAAAAAVATLQVVQEEGLLANAAARGEQLQAGLRAMAQRHPGLVAQVRGRGCMVGLELAAPLGSGLAGAVTAEAMARGLLLLTTGWRETIRLIPALIVTEQDCQFALQVIEDSLVAAAGKMAK